MKKLFLLFIASITLSSNMFSQTDPDWIIVNNQFVPIESIQQESSESIYEKNKEYLLLEDMTPPSTFQCNGNAGDDFLVIFEDGTYYNSRELRTEEAPIAGYQFDENGLKLKTEKKVAYMALTEVYDTGGRPTGARRTTNNTEYDERHPNNLDFPARSENILSANRNAVPGKDITLIVDLSQLNTSKMYRLTVPRALRGGTTLQNSEICAFSNVFSENFYLGNVDANSINSNDTLYFSPKSNSRYLFVNYKVDHSMIGFDTAVNNVYSQIEFSLDSVTPYSKDGEIAEWNNSLYSEIPSKSWMNQSKHFEEIRDAHDPNYIALNTLCENNIAKYEIYFYNQEPISANQISCQIDLENSPKIDSVCITSAFYNGKEISIEINLDENQIDLHLDEAQQIIGCVNGNINPVVINMDVQFSNEIDTEMNFEPSEAYTFFNKEKTSGKKKFVLNYKDRSYTFNRKLDTNSNRVITNSYRRIKECESCFPQPKKKRWPFIVLTAIVAAVLAFVAVD